MKTYGLTGGIGSGKSLAAAAFAKHGIPTIDLDAIGHTVIGPEGAATKSVIDAFGADIISCGTIDRQALGEIVFSDDAALTRLNRLVHPAIGQELERQCARLAVAGHVAIIVEAALLGENMQFEPWLDGLILVLCSESTRVRRLVSSGRMNASQAQQRIAAQVPPESKRGLAKWVIDNEGTEEDLVVQVDAIVRAL